MKKSLVALAALAATTAFAQSSVTLYGNIDQSVYRSSADAGWMMSANSNGGSTSLWGITGTEDLGGGTKASFDLKSELTLLSGQTGSSTTGLTAGSPGNATVFNRGANLALSNDGLGTATIGRQNDAWWETTTKFNNTGLNSYGWANATATVSGAHSLNSLYNGASKLLIDGYTGVTGTIGANTGASNVASMGTGTAFFGGLSYATPVISGFQFKYAKGAPKAGYTVQGDANQVTSASLTYANGPLTAAYAQSTRTDANGANAMQNKMLGVKYVFGQYTLTYGNNKTTIGGTARTTDGGHDADVNAFGVGYALNAKWNIDVGYTTIKDKDDTSNKLTSTAVVGKYAFSKRTSWYVGYGKGKNEGASNIGIVYAGGTAPGIGKSETSFITGIKHAF